jgi:hypothetical protein
VQIAYERSCIFKIDLTHIAQAFATLVRPTSVLHNPRTADLAAAPSQTNPKCRKAWVPFKMILLALGQRQVGNGFLCEFHDSPSFWEAKFGHVVGWEANGNDPRVPGCHPAFILDTCCTLKLLGKQEA